MKLFGHVFGSGGKATMPHVSSASWSDRGLVRADNQDNFLVMDACMTYCVADGMGGGEGGAKASEIACREVGAAAGAATGFIERVRMADDAVKKANAEIRAFARKMGYRQMATTATVLMFDPEDPVEAVVGYIGDTRAYRWRAGTLYRITRDHTMAEELNRIAKLGLGPELTGRSCKLAHILTRAVGIEDEVNLDWRRVDAQVGDWFLVCSDGVYDMLDDKAIAAAIGGSAVPEDAVSALARGIVANGADDNFTMVVLKIGG